MTSLGRRERSVRSPTEESKKLEEVGFDTGFVEVLRVVNDADARGGEIVEKISEKGDCSGNRGCGAIEGREGGGVDTLVDGGEVSVEVGEEGV